MKRLFALFLVALIACHTFAVADSFDNMTDEELDAYVASLLHDQNSALEIQERAVVAIEYFKSILYDSEIDRVEINPNYGTIEDGDFIALIYMNYDLHRPGADKEVLVHNSNIIADALSNDCPEIVEAVVFWNLTGYELTGKISYTIDEEGFHYGDAMLPKEMVE